MPTGQPPQPPEAPSPSPHTGLWSSASLAAYFRDPIRGPAPEFGTVSGCKPGARRQRHDEASRVRTPHTAPAIRDGGPGLCFSGVWGAPPQ